MARKTAARTLVALAVFAMASLGTTAAFAGEITGTGESLKQPDGTLHGRSICAFSGLNDTYSGDPNVPDDEGFFLTQSWGQIPKEVRDIIGPLGNHPGQACNPNIGE